MVCIQVAGGFPIAGEELMDARALAVVSLLKVAIVGYYPLIMNHYPAT